MFSSFDDISSLKTTSDRFYSTAGTKRRNGSKIAPNPNPYTTYLVWLIILLIFCLLVVTGISVVLWRELNTFQEEFKTSLDQIQQNTESPEHNLQELTNYNGVPENAFFLLESQVGELKQKLEKLLEYEGIFHKFQ